jgi:ubiquinone/menaquinone biosynthesis C-methylase UbiE
MEVPLPVETDYPSETFDRTLAPECRAGCAYAYFKTNFFARRLFRQRVDIAFNLIPDSRCNRALDAGTGAGFLLPGLASRCREVDGVDLAAVLHYTQSMLEKRRLSNVKLVQADLLHLPYPRPTFDLAVCLSVIEHVPEPETALRELARVLQPDGVLILGYPLENAFFVMLEWMIRTEKRLRLLCRGKVRPRAKAFRPHVTDCRALDSIVAKVFHIEDRREMRILGIPVYRIFKLRKP